jgi:hypothetical protein
LFVCLFSHSIKPHHQNTPLQIQDERMLAIREDVAEWLNSLLGLSVTEAQLFDELATGVHVCELALMVEAAFAEDKRLAAEGLAPLGRPLRGTPWRKFLAPPPGAPAALRFNRSARPHSFQARDNVSVRFGAHLGSALAHAGFRPFFGGAARWGSPMCCCLSRTISSSAAMRAACSSACSRLGASPPARAWVRCYALGCCGKGPHANSTHAEPPQLVALEMEIDDEISREEAATAEKANHGGEPEPAPWEREQDWWKK